MGPSLNSLFDSAKTVDGCNKLKKNSNTIKTVEESRGEAMMSDMCFCPGLLCKTGETYEVEALSLSQACMPRDALSPSKDPLRIQGELKSLLSKPRLLRQAVQVVFDSSPAFVSSPDRVYEPPALASSINQKGTTPEGSRTSRYPVIMVYCSLLPSCKV